MPKSQPPKPHAVEDALLSLPIAAAIREMLVDGLPHLEFELMLGLLNVIPPEIAARSVSARTPSGRTRSLEERVKMGITRYAHSALVGLAEAGEIKRETVNGKPGWRRPRLIDEEKREDRELAACRRAFESAGMVKALQDAVLICAEQDRPLPRWLMLGIVRTLDGLPAPAERDVVDHVRYLAVRDGKDLGLTWPEAYQYAEDYLVPIDAAKGGVETMKKAYKRVHRGLLETPERFFVARGDGVDLTFQPTVEHIEAVMFKYLERKDLKVKKHKTQTGAAPFPLPG